MASLTKVFQLQRSSASRLISTSSIVKDRFGTDKGESGWKWEKNGVGMGGKDKGVATEIKPDLGKDKTYKAPEFFGYNDMSFYDIEASVEKQRCPQPKSGLTEYW